MRSYLSERAGCLYKQTDGSWNVLDTLRYRIPLDNVYLLVGRLSVLQGCPTYRGYS
jgi:hypothetical protein